MTRPACQCAARGAACTDDDCSMGPKGAEYDPATMCRSCWLYHNDPAYRELWSGAPALPSFWQRAKTFAGAALAHAAAGLPTVDDAEYEARLAACHACEFLVDNHCAKCGCRVAGAVLSKARWKEQACPLGKWPVPPPDPPTGP